MEINLIAETRSAQQNSEMLKNCELTKKKCLKICAANMQAFAI